MAGETMALLSHPLDSHTDTQPGMTSPHHYPTHLLVGGKERIRGKEPAVSWQQQEETTTWEQEVQDPLPTLLTLKG